MTSALTPELALRYLAELDPAIEAAGVTTADGAHLAGDTSLSARLAASTDGSGGLRVARSSRYAVIAQVRHGALEGLVRHDLDAVARDLGDG